MDDRHTVSIEDLDAWLDEEFWRQAAASYGNGSSKKLEKNEAGIWRVTDHSKVVYSGLSKKAALDAYNATP